MVGQACRHSGSNGRRAPQQLCRRHALLLGGGLGGSLLGGRLLRGGLLGGRLLGVLLVGGGLGGERLGGSGLGGDVVLYAARLGEGECAGVPRDRRDDDDPGVRTLTSAPRCEGGDDK